MKKGLIIGKEIKDIILKFKRIKMVKKDLRKEIVKALEGKPKGTPIRRFGEIRNECWNCKNYPREIKPEGEKGYYKCEYCGKWMHK